VINIDLRKKIFLAALAGGAAHLASSFSVVEILEALYLRGVLRHNPKDPAWSERDIFILSKGHATLALYTALCEAGYFSSNTLRTYLKPGSILGGEANPLDTPGIEAWTGSLGQGLPVAVGKALAFKIDDRPNHVFALVGDGEAQEGTIWEAAMFAAAQKLSNLTVIFDNNRIQKMDKVKNIMGFDAWEDKWRAFGFDIISADGHDTDALVRVLTEAKNAVKPLCVIANTVKGKGVSVMEDSRAWHYRLPGRREMKYFMTELGVTQEEIDIAKGISERNI
jgi:transketolase